ncbi:hypothetical protein K503DRAFT_806419 [Rhizopogon vinicolor AM-OR11-026]|uniref:Uncharacterized protein n=1 Tax=Rhizopogon vinicolor AM-OR11-026 TaxID=1314800 RepID=A0A1B7MEM5_9AGAM|nr:hypothetical protein K503DRAFT_806419 [Rhizopogon vinicolor AM-OR11-026]
MIPNAEWTTEIGEAAVINQELKVRFGSCVNDLKLLEQGLETEAVVDVLEVNSCDIILEKWLDGAPEAARGWRDRKSSHFDFDTP